MVAHSTALTAENSNTVCLIYIYRSIVFLGQLYDDRQVGHIAFHAENTIDYDEFDGIFLARFKRLLERSHIVVFKFQRVGETQATAFYNRSMVELVPDNVILTACQAGNYSHIHLEPGRINDGFFLTNKTGQSIF